MKKIVLLPLVCVLFVSLTADAVPPEGAHGGNPEYDEDDEAVHHDESMDQHEHVEEGISMDHDDPVSMEGEQDSPWPFGFTDAQMHRLRQLGCLFDHNDLLLAQRLAARGFGAREFVQAYEDSRRILGEVPPHKHLENLVVFRHLGLPVNQFSDFVSSGGTLTDYYNSQIGGRGNIIAGAILLGTGLPPLGLGILFLSLGASAARRDDDMSAKALYTLGGIFAGTGGILSGIGLPLIVVGREKLRRWAPANTMERSDSRQLYQYRITYENQSDYYSMRSKDTPSYPAHAAAGDPMTLYMTPSILPGGGGLSFSLTW